MDAKSLELLEFPQVKEILARHTAFSASRELALSLLPLDDYETVSLLLKQSAEARQLLAVEPGFSIGGVMDIREPARLATIGKVLEPRTLLEIQQTLAAMSHLRMRLRRLSTEFPLLWRIAEGIAEMNTLEKNIASCIAPSAEVLDRASPGLARVRQQLRETREQLLARLGTMMRSPRGRRIVQEPIITERDGRYVIPVKIEMQNEVKGIVHDISNTGASVFIEPLVTLDMGNRLKELVVEEQREIERILRDLSTQVGAHVTEIARSIARVAELDLALAKARYAQKMQASEPVLTGFDGDKAGKQNHVLKLVEARHPLLTGKAVPLTVEIGKDYSILVITGPNTGGKTVALKTIGLLSVMTLAGIPIPAAPQSQIPFFDEIFADIGDEQSIAQTLSTFSWHMGNIKRITEKATAKSLVLLDELGTSTDPSEGSALARSILLHFLTRGTMTVATTHFSDLKAFAHTTPGLQNASLDFDPETLMPTYHLVVGVPGGSNALATATRLGVPEEIVARAREMLSRGSQELEALLINLSAERQKLRALQAELERERLDWKQRNAELEKRLQELKDEEQKLLQENRDKIVREVAELHRELRQASAELKRRKTKEALEKAKASITAVQEKLKGERWQVKTEEKPEDGGIRVGDSVWLKDAHLWATVLSFSEETQEVEVQSGRLKLKLGIDSVEKAKPPEESGVKTFTPAVKTAERKAVSRELDLRGKRADEAAWLLESYLNSASVAGLKEVRIIHGTATGTVRRIVREALAGHPLVSSFRSGGQGEGGDGVTIAKL